MFYKHLRFLLILTVISFSLPLIMPSNVKSKTDLSLVNKSDLFTINWQNGRYLYQQTKFADSIIYLQKAYENAVQQDNHKQQIKSLNLMSMGYQKLGEWQKAKRLINQSTQLIESQTNINPEIIFLWSQTLNIQGQIEFATGNSQQALLVWQEAQKQAENINDLEGIQGSLINQVTAYASLGEYIKANKILQKLQINLEQTPDSEIKLYGLVSLATILQKQGELKQSEILLRKTLLVAEQFMSPMEIENITLILADVLKDLDKTSEALALYEQIINYSSQDELVVKAKLNELAIAIAQKKYRNIDDSINNIKNEINRLIISRDNLYIHINFVQNLFNLSAQIGKKYNDDILEVLTQSLVKGEQIKDNIFLAYSYGMLGKLYLQEDRLTEAQQLTNKALLLADQSKMLEVKVLWQGQMGRIYQKRGNLPEAISFYQSAIDNLDSFSRDLYNNNTELQFSFRDSVEPIYRELINLLLSDKNPSVENIKRAIKIFEQLHIAELKNFFGDGCLIRKSAEQLQDNTAAIIHPIILADRLVIITSLPNDKYSYHSININQVQLESTLIETRNSLHPTASSHTRKRLTKQLYDWLIVPIEDELQQSDISSLIFTLDGVMRNFPMASLYDGQKYLIENYAIALMPIRVDLLDPNPWQTEKLNILIGGLSESRQGFTSLPSVEKEIVEIASLSPSKILFNQNFTENNLTELVATTSFPILHLATHGQFSSQQEDTFLVTWDETINIKELETLIKSRNTQQAIELLILSACQTAIGDKRAALGLAGLAMRSGARSVVATLWSVNDESTAEFMVHFYQELQKTEISKSEALRQAQMKLIQSPTYSHPYYWAPFVMLGNWL